MRRKGDATRTPPSFMADRSHCPEVRNRRSEWDKLIAPATHVATFSAAMKTIAVVSTTRITPKLMWRKYRMLTLCRKNAPTLASCTAVEAYCFDKHGLILIILGKLHQHTFKNDMRIRLESIYLYLLNLLLNNCDNPCLSKLQLAKLARFFETQCT